MKPDIEACVQKAIIDGWSPKRICDTYSISKSSLYRLKKKMKSEDKTPEITKTKEITKDFSNKTGVITVKSLNIKTLDEALKIAEVDLSVWEVDRFIVNSWETTMGRKNTNTNKPETYTNFQVKIWLKKKSVDILAMEGLLEKIKANSPIVPVRKLSRSNTKNPRELEISLADLHLGLRCSKPAADIDWTPEQAEEFTMNILEELLQLAKVYGQYERIVFPMGNDFLHTDYVYNTTTKGTPQPEADAWKNTFMRGKRLALEIIERMKQEAPVKIISVPGNHARHTEIALAHIMDAYYHNDKNVEVDCSMSPFKFHHYGVNLIGFEHGHSIKQQLRLASLMANECRLSGWADARYCEWHLGDQHRKASGKPAHFEEQGVSVEFLPGLVPPNEWHRIHGFNWQKRAGLAFVWDKKSGPIARFQVNVDNYTGKIM